MSEEPTGQLYELRITATGEVRDADGNLVNNTPIESITTLTEAEAREFSEGQLS